MPDFQVLEATPSQLWLRESRNLSWRQCEGCSEHLDFHTVDATRRRFHFLRGCGGRSSCLTSAESRSRHG